MIEREITVGYEMGLHARPAAHFVQHASRYASNVWLEREGQRVNGKSILGILMLAAEKNSLVKLIVQGQDEAVAIDFLSTLIVEGKVE